jgi:WD40 repeat protein
MPLSLPRCLLRHLDKVTALFLALLALLAAPYPRDAAAGEARKPRLDLFGDPLPEEAVARLGSARLRHPGIGRRSFLFSPDGKQIVSSTRDRLWISDTATGKLLRRFDFDHGSIRNSCRHMGDSIICADVSNAGIVTVQVLDAATGQLRRRLRIKEPAAVLSIAVSSDGKRLVVPQRNANQLYDTTTGEMVQRIPVKGLAGWSLAFAADGKSIASTNYLSDTIYLHDTATGKLIRELKRPGDSALHLVFSPDGRFLASLVQSRTAEKGEVSIWRVSDGKEVHRWTHPFPKAMSAAFSPDGKRVAIGGARWGMVLRDVETGKEVRRLSPQGGVAQVAFSLDGKVLATASDAIRLWDAATGKLLPVSANPAMDSAPLLRFSSDGKRVFGHGGAGICLIWDAATGRELKRFADPQPLDFKHPSDLHRLVLSPDESLLAIVRPQEKISLRDAATGKEKHTLQGGDETWWRLLFTPDSRRLISSGNKDVVHVWDVASGRELHHMPGSFTLAISPDGRFLATKDAGTMTVFVYDLTTGQETKRFTFPQAGMAAGSAFLSDLAFAPDGSSLAAVGNVRDPRAPQPGLIRLWDLTGSGRVHSFDSQKVRMLHVALSPDGRSLATGGFEGELILWEVSSGRQRHAFVGHEDQVISLAFSPDGRTLAASSAGAAAYVWDVAGSLQSKPRRLANDELQHCWSTLGGEDASAAFQAIRQLAAASEQTLPFLREHLKPVPVPDQKRLRQLVDMLDNADFSTRQKAVEQLEKQNDAAAGLLRQIVDKEKPSLEVRRRLQQIVESIENKPKWLRAFRAVEVLEWIRTPDAVRLLGELSNGAADARLTREAAAAKRRFQR